MHSPLLFAILLCNCLASDIKITTISEPTTGFDFKGECFLYDSSLALIHKYSWEVLGFVLLLVYGMYFMVGRKKNLRIVNNWYVLCSLHES